MKHSREAACGRPLQTLEQALDHTLVDGEHGADALAERLAQHRLGLHAHALDDVHHHERAVGDAQRGCDL